MIYNNVLEIIGNTPIVRYEDNICLKLEYYNPSNSIKDRAAYSIIKSAMERGEINKDTVIIEPTSGNMGIGLAMCAAVLGLKIIICMPESMSTERRKLIQAYGAELVLTPKELGMQGAVNKAKELIESTENSYMPMQFANPDNPLAHKQTAEEIEKSLDGKPCVVVAGIGTGGTAVGLKKYLKDAVVYGVEPKESPLLTQGKAAPHGIQGIGANFIPEICKDNNLDGVITVTTEDAIDTAKELARRYGVFSGISGGANLCAAKTIAQKHSDRTVVAIIPDNGERYLSIW